MPHVTSIGLDVHARSVAAAAFNPFTGEVVHRDFGTDAAEIAEWALGFEEPRACYESGPTGFRMARELWIGNTYLDDFGRDSPASLNSTGDM